ncbi:MAG: hypothetical protein E5X43_10330 [Mesorhizobium sp.]|nr:MAG: hypothetical protein E5X43_10330 [Mesorhizobium sp.]
MKSLGDDPIHGQLDRAAVDLPSSSRPINGLANNSVVSAAIRMVNPDLAGLRFMMAPSGWKCRNQAIAPHLKGERDCLRQDAFMGT